MQVRLERLWHEAGGASPMGMHFCYFEDNQRLVDMFERYEVSYGTRRPIRKVGGVPGSVGRLDDGAREDEEEQ